jgi:hypothetical protein
MEGRRARYGAYLSYNDRNRGPAVPNGCRQFEAVHAAGHVNIREEDLDFRMCTKHLDGGVSVCSFKDGEATSCQFFSSVHEDQGIIFDNQHYWELGHWSFRFLKPERNRLLRYRIRPKPYRSPVRNHDHL